VSVRLCWELEEPAGVMTQADRFGTAHVHVVVHDRHRAATRNLCIVSARLEITGLNREYGVELIPWTDLRKRMCDLENSSRSSLDLIHIGIVLVQTF
jgi:hypothetical protein